MTTYFVGVDVGTGSVRAALVSDQGKILETAVKETMTWNDQPDFYEQSFDDIWRAICTCVKKVVEKLGPKCVKGIGFDATCSLVVFDQNHHPLSVSPTGRDDRNIILWMDHRAVKEAEFINKTNHPLLKFVGGKVSPEMEIPKLMWLKKNLKKECWDKAGLFFDLPDALTWRATDEESRSTCSLVCKWNYDMSGEKGKWDKTFFEKVDLMELAENNWKKIGGLVVPPGTAIACGLSDKAAQELGLLPGTAVGASMIDAHAGGIGLIGCRAEGIDRNFETRLGLICGTSTCHMAVAKKPLFVPGVWGPYKDAMIPGMWLNEGGQSATGKLIDHMINCHPATEVVKDALCNVHMHEYLNNVLTDVADKQELNSIGLLTKDIHIWPDFHGNRSPLADPSLKGMVSGLTLAADAENLALTYLATVQALSYGTRYILETLKKNGYGDIKSTLLCGGLSKNPVFAQTQADVCGIPAVCPDECESVLLGAAILGACAAGHFNSMNDAIKTMGGKGKVMHPNKEIADFHNKKYLVFMEMYKAQLAYRKIMTGSSCESTCPGRPAN